MSNYDQYDNDVASEDVYGSGNYLTDGTGVFIINNIERKKTRKGHVCDFFEVYIESAAPHRVVSADGKVLPDAVQNAAGDFRTIQCRVDDKENPGRRKAKEIYLASIGEKDRKGDPAFDEKLRKIMQRARSEEQLLRGTAVAFTSKRTKTKRGVELPEFNYSAVTPQNKQTIAERRAKLEGAVAMAKQKEAEAAEQKSAAGTAEPSTATDDMPF